MVIAVKFVKGISLFFVYPVVMLGIGFYAGVRTTHFFYPGEQTERLYYVPSENETPALEDGNEPELPENTLQSMEECLDYEKAEDTDLSAYTAVSNDGETLCVETEYIIEEKDLDDDTVVETSCRLPMKYVGMNREQFLEAMEEYEAFPPLSEMERGFVSLEVLSFSRERVVVQMNYRFLVPTSSFYLAVYDNEVVVYLEDKETIYIETEILLDQLPEELQQEIIDMMWMPDEEALYDFLETYSS